MSNLSPKTAIPFILNHYLNQWLNDYARYSRDLDRINGQLQWTQEAVAALDTSHDLLPLALSEAFKHFDLTTRKPLYE